MNTTQLLLSKHFPINWAHISQFFSYLSRLVTCSEKLKANYLGVNDLSSVLQLCSSLHPQLLPLANTSSASGSDFSKAIHHHFQHWLDGNFWDVTMFEFYVAAWSSCGLWNLKWVLLGRGWVGWFTKFSLAMSSRVVGRPLSRETTRLHQESWPLAKLWVFHLKQEKSETQGLIYNSGNI